MGKRDSTPLLLFSEDDTAIIQDVQVRSLQQAEGHLLSHHARLSHCRPCVNPWSAVSSRLLAGKFAWFAQPWRRLSPSLKLFYSQSYTLASYAFDTTRKAGWVAESLRSQPIAGVELEE